MKPETGAGGWPLVWGAVVVFSALCIWIAGSVPRLTAYPVAWTEKTTASH